MDIYGISLITFVMYYVGSVLWWLHGAYVCVCIVGVHGKNRGLKWMWLGV